MLFICKQYFQKIYYVQKNVVEDWDSVQLNQGSGRFMKE